MMRFSKGHLCPAEGLTIGADSTTKEKVTYYRGAGGRRRGNVARNGKAVTNRSFR